MEFINADGELCTVLESGRVVASKDSYILKDFDEDKADVVVQLLSEGQPLDQVLEAVEIKHRDYIHWISTSEDFRASCHQAKMHRADHILEKSYTHDILPLHDEAIDPVQIALASKRVDVVKKFMTTAFPNFYKDNSVSIDKAAVSVNITIPEEIKKQDKNFIPEIGVDGSVSL